MSFTLALTSVLRSFDDLIVDFHASYRHEDLVPLVAWQDALGRLRMWATDMTVHQQSHSSLDVRLQDAAHISHQILKLLHKLVHVIEEIKKSLDETYKDLMYVDSNGQSVTELQQLFEQVMTIINCLYQLSLVMRKPAPFDEPLNGKYEQDTQLYEQMDMQYAISKHPEADPWLVARLGQSISRRRDYLRSHQRDHAKLAQGIDHAVRIYNTNTDVGHSETLSNTIAESFMNSLSSSDDILSEMSSSRDLSVHNGSTIHVPRPPKASAGYQPFECPSCFLIITINDQYSWTRHMFKDLQPYVCTFRYCQTAHQLYDQRHEWFDHELTMHQREWFEERVEKGYYPESIRSPSSMRKIRARVSCPLCPQVLDSFSSIEQHLAQHLEELALFAMPWYESEQDQA